MKRTDPIEELTHDHRQLTELVFVVRERLTARYQGEEGGPRSSPRFEQLLDELVTHAAREEEGLFPFVAANAPDLEPRARTLQASHDATCGTVSRLAHAVGRLRGAHDEELTACRELFARFEELYARHARDEAAILDELGRTLNEAQRQELRAALAGL